MSYFKRPSTSLFSSEFTCNRPFDRSVHLSSNDMTGTQWLVPNSHSPSHMQVRIKQSKTVAFRQDQTITRAKSSPPICSMMAMKDYLLQAQSPSSHLCSPSSNPDNGLHRTISQESLGQFFKTVVSLLKISTPTVSVLELPLKTAAKAGLPPWVIKVVGQWSSECYERYIRTPKCTILELPRLLANTSQ